ncbi:hypothetical protein D1013_02960 [Euzebyella marina]|uniref:Lipocalin-like domain-containing protein n=1 Tax=Euzebyella marina TaxID=1761453 RepID=A0A3G2L2D7_9FLAO|nr:hypothetical protein [Euzebyella marina]AYN66415.1 hypothetical protein D1013_02960 [Euzebyella marina]MBG47614.1 hypothetical protein [Pseudozobellia sp.]|tara:strand:- start:180 stop:548 length:369 start_codon:yes stop_codon:yes gene_type:complete
MKKIAKHMGLLICLTLVAVSCSKDNDPTDDNLFVGTYNGSVSYSEPDTETEISTDDGRVTVVKVGDNYRFDFSNGIPSINGVTMEKNQNILVNSSGTIKIDEGELIIAFIEGGETWGANCTR